MRRLKILNYKDNLEVGLKAFEGLLSEFRRGNIELAKGFSIVHWLYGLTKPILARRLKEKKGYYFSPDYSMDHYPKSQAAKSLTNPDEFLEISRFAAGSGICRAIIDLDRYLYLVEHEYNVWYRAEMFVAENKGNSEC